MAKSESAPKLFSRFKRTSFFKPKETGKAAGAQQSQLPPVVALELIPDTPASTTTQAKDKEDSTAKPSTRPKKRIPNGLLGLDRAEQPGWNPLFDDDDIHAAADVEDEGVTSNGKKEKGKAKATNPEASEESLVDPTFEDLKSFPKAYKVISGRHSSQCPDYNYASLFRGKRVHELWDEAGDTLVYLCPKNSTTPRGPSFFVKSQVLQAISDYWIVAFSAVWQGGFDIDNDTYPHAKYALFFAADRPDGKNEETDGLVLLRHYITIRNVFACIFDSYCVGLVEDDSSLLSDLVDRMLMYFEGAEAGLGTKLSEFIIKSGLWDVTNDPIKAVDLLHLADRYEMREIYTEAFAHCVGM